MNLFSEVDSSYDIDNGAVISSCKNYRYKLWRIWDNSRSKILFLMLNPSTADATVDDPTIRRLKDFSIKWGFGGFYVGNLFAFRTSKPEKLVQAFQLNSLDYIIGEENSSHIEQMRLNCREVCFAWGNWAYKPDFISRTRQVQIDFPNAKCIDTSLQGYPKHPLYLHSSLTLKHFQVTSIRI